jgi:hypothetical protein
MIDELEGFQDFSLLLDMLSTTAMQQILPKSAQNYPNLPKDN